MREHLFGVSQIVRQYVVYVAGPLQDVADDHVQVDGQRVGFETKSPETDVRLMLQVI